MAAVHYDSFTSAREHLKDVLDQASGGAAVTVRRDSATAVVLDAARFRHFLASVVPSSATVVAEAEGWSALFPGLPIAGSGASLDAAIADLIDALREYAEDWVSLQHAPNHRENWGLVQLVALSDDDQLRQWITGGS